MLIPKTCSDASLARTANIAQTAKIAVCVMNAQSAQIVLIVCVVRRAETAQTVWAARPLWVAPIARTAGIVQIARTV